MNRMMLKQICSEEGKECKGQAGVWDGMMKLTGRDGIGGMEEHP
jgi:hypothetical protein